MQINEDKLNEFVGKAMGDLGAALTSSLVSVLAASSVEVMGFESAMAR
mgnify:CR=1 FL=1